MAIQYTSNEYQIPRGRVYFDQFDAQGSLTGELPFGNCPEFTVSIESEKSDHYSSEAGLRQKDASVTVEVNRTASMTCDNLSAVNLARYLAGSLETVTQASGSVTDEAMSLRSARHYQIGATPSNPAGVRNISALTVTVAATVWADEAAVAAGAIVKPSTGADLHYYRCITPGETGATEPTWPVNGSTVTDGTAVWEDCGPLLLVAGTDINVDLELGRLQALETIGEIPTPVILAYTRPAKTWQRIKTGASTELAGAVRVIADNASGADRDFYMPKVNLTPSGDMPVITSDTDFVSMEFSVEILKPANAEAIYVDGRPLVL
jgi:hypothetical protein